MRLLILLTFLVGLISAPAQQIEHTSGIDLLHRERKTTRHITLGTKIVFKANDVREKGVLEEVTHDHITVDGVDYRIRDMQWIGLKNFGSYAKAVGIGIVGIGVTASGGVYATEASGGGYVQPALIMLSGVGITILGVRLFGNGSRLYLDSDWKIIPPPLEE